MAANPSTQLHCNGVGLGKFIASPIVQHTLSLLAYNPPGPNVIQITPTSGLITTRPQPSESVGFSISMALIGAVSKRETRHSLPLNPHSSDTREAKNAAPKTGVQVVFRLPLNQYSGGPEWVHE